MASLLWLEGVDFSEHIDDTNDISIIRGASLALLAAPEAAQKFLRSRPGLSGVTRVFSGASLALFRLPASVEDARTHAAALLAHLATPQADSGDAKTPPLPLAYLRFVAGVATDDGGPLGVRRAQFAARTAQMTGDYPRRLVTPAERMCVFTRRLPADTTMTLTTGQIERLNVGSSVDDANAIPVSSSAKARRRYGRRARRTLFSQLGLLPTGERYDFTHDLHEMVDIDSAALAPGRRLPMSVKNKIAVFYADGNRFTHIRNALGGGPEQLAEFSRAVRDLIERKVLYAVLQELIARAESPDAARRASAVFAGETVAEDDDAAVKLRFELLLYGGDEFCFIVPAWLGLDLAELFFRKIAGATHHGHALTFKAGLVFAPYKMPIAASRELAKRVAEAARIDGASSLCVRAFESVEPPANGLEAMDRALFGDPDGADGGAAAKFARACLPIPADNLSALLSDLRALKREAFPRSQLYRALNVAQWRRDEKDKKTGPRDWPLGLGVEAVNRVAARILASYSGLQTKTETWERALAYFSDINADRAALNAWLFTHLWDYVDPFAFEASMRDEAA